MIFLTYSWGYVHQRFKPDIGYGKEQKFLCTYYQVRNTLTFCDTSDIENPILNRYNAATVYIHWQCIRREWPKRWKEISSLSTTEIGSENSMFRIFPINYYHFLNYVMKNSKGKLGYNELYGTVKYLLAITVNSTVSIC